MESSQKILDRLKQAHQAGQLPEGVQPELLPYLAGCLAAVIARMNCPIDLDAAEAFPYLVAMAKNLYLDGPRVQALINGDAGLWDDTRLWLLNQAHWIATRLDIRVDEDDLADIVQNVLVRLLRALPGFEYRASFRGYAFRFLKNEVLRWVERDNRRPPLAFQAPARNGEQEPDERELLVDLLQDTQPGPEQQLIDSELRAWARQFLGAYRFTIVWLHLAGYTLDEIRRYLERQGSAPPSISTLSRIQKRALDDLQQAGYLGAELSSDQC